VPVLIRNFYILPRDIPNDRLLRRPREKKSLRRVFDNAEDLDDVCGVEKRARFGKGFEGGVVQLVKLPPVFRTTAAFILFVKMRESGQVQVVDPCKEMEKLTMHSTLCGTQLFWTQHQIPSVRWTADATTRQMSTKELNAASTSCLFIVKRDKHRSMTSGEIWLRFAGCGEKARSRREARMSDPFKIAMTVGVEFTVRGALVGGIPTSHCSTRGKSPKRS
jgi:hypothetical protein